MICIFEPAASVLHCDTVPAERRTNMGLNMLYGWGGDNFPANLEA